MKKMHLKTSFVSIYALRALLVIVLGSLVFISFGAYAAKDVLKSVGFTEELKEENDLIHIPWGKAKLITVDGDVADVLLANPEIVNVMAVKSNQLYVVGVNFGDTNLLVLDHEGDVLRDIDIHVMYDVDAIQQYVDEMFPNEDANISMLHDQLILTGTVSTPDVANKIVHIVGHYFSDLIDESDDIDSLLYNMLEVRGEQQVTLRVRIMEVSRDILKEFTNQHLSISDLGETFGGNLAGVASRSTNAATTITPPGTSFPTNSGGASEAGFSYFGLLSNFGAFGPVNYIFSALEDEGLASLLAEPNLTAVSGEQAGFLAGGEFPVPSGIDSNGNVVVTFRSFGVALNFVPRVLDNDRIVLQLNTEVSSLNRSESVTLSGVEVPGIDIRRAETTVEVGSGSSLMIAGLLQSETVQGYAGLPGIRNTPVLGDLLTSDGFERQETELVIIVTPLVVKPYADRQHTDDSSVRSQQINNLALAFAKNIRREFDYKKDIWGDNNDFGYLID